MKYDFNVKNISDFSDGSRVLQFLNEASTTAKNVAGAVNEVGAVIPAYGNYRAAQNNLVAQRKIRPINKKWYGYAALAVPAVGLAGYLGNRYLNPNSGYRTRKRKEKSAFYRLRQSFR